MSHRERLTSTMCAQEGIPESIKGFPNAIQGVKDLAIQKRIPIFAVVALAGPGSTLQLFGRYAKGLRLRITASFSRLSSVWIIYLHPGLVP